MEEAAVSYAEGVAKALVGKLGQLLSDEYQLLRSVRGGVVHLRDEMAIMNALLRMLSEAEDGSVNHFVREWMKQVRELNYDAEDRVDIFARRISSVPPGSLRGIWHRFVTLGERHRLARDIRDLRARALDISERRARYNVDSQALRPSTSFVASAGLVAYSSTHQALQADPDQFVGIQKKVADLAAMVRPANGEPDTKLKVFSIVGFGGLGKTTLALEVCRFLVADFNCQANVSVSQAFDASKDLAALLRRVLGQLKVKRGNHKGTQEEESVGNLDAMDLEDLTSTLKTFVVDKRYLIMIDDIWNLAAWKSIRCRLPENNHSSRIIVTTRMENVAQACSPASISEDNIYRIQHLGPQDSEKLFVNRVFGANDTCPKELEKAMNGILKKCGGLPLAIVSIASLLANYKSPGNHGMWNRVCNSIGSQMEINPTLEGMRQILTLSYNYLPYHLKACMMYLSIFPEDYMIGKHRLLYRWIAEGLVPEKRGLTSTEVAEACFDELLSRNMIKPGWVQHDGEVVECCVHDIMLEVILSKSLEENFVSLVGSHSRGTSYDNVRRLSIQGDEPRSFVHEMSMQHVRSLTTFRPEGQIKLLDRLSEFVLLRVLDLEHCKDLKNCHMKHVCRLLLLRFLNLNHTDVTMLPSQIGELIYLQTLWLNNTLLDGLPKSVIKLVNLENVGFSNRRNWRKLLRLPLGLRKMKALHGLARLEIRVDDTELAIEIGDLVQLQKLHIVLNCNNCYGEGVLKEIAKSIGRICSLHEFSVQDMRSNANNMKFLHEIPSPPLQIRYLNIGGTIDKLPCWVESLTHLTHIELWWVNLHGDEIYGVLWKLPNLLKISLDRNCCKDKNLVARTSFKFQVLKEMSFVPYDCNQHMPEVLQFEEGAMEKLERLTVRFDDFKRCLVGVENLTGLKEVQLQGMRDNIAMQNAVVQLQTESNKRPKSKRFKVLLKYV